MDDKRTVAECQTELLDENVTTYIWSGDDHVHLTPLVSRSMQLTVLITVGRDIKLWVEHYKFVLLKKPASLQGQKCTSTLR